MEPMDVPYTGRITADDFLAWSIQQPEGKRYELVDGRIHAMAAERYGHVLVKGLIYSRLLESITRAGLFCTALADGMAVRIDDETVYEPDAAVRCGDIIPFDAVEYTDPVIVVEVLSPSTRAIDSQAKLLDYFRLSSLRHYIIAHPDRRTVVHHRWTATGLIETSIATGELILDPPGLTLDVAQFFPKAD